MKSVSRLVFYCDFCGRHRLTKNAIEKHEPKCIRNPARVCGWEFPGHPAEVELPRLAAELRARAPLAAADLLWLDSETGGCPACMLAALVQSDLHGDARGDFNYDAEVEKFRTWEREIAMNERPW